MSFTALKSGAAFKKRHALRSIVLHVGPGSGSAIQVAREIHHFRDKVLNYPYEQIYNADYTRLFVKLISRRKNVLNSDGKNSVRGERAMKARE